MEIEEKAFQTPRTPVELEQYVREAYKYILSRPDLKKVARLRKGSYKKLIEELLPFSVFCSWKYGQRTDVLCHLVPGTPGRDAVIKDLSIGIEHSVEITWPIEGKLIISQARQLNLKGATDIEIWNHDDLTKQQLAIDRTIDIARKKALRDYRFSGGSTILFVFEDSLFWETDPRHMGLLDLLVKDLRDIPLKAATVILMLMPRGRIIVVKDSNN
jgi:hypothetical protein